MTPVLALLWSLIFIAATVILQTVGALSAFLLIFAFLLGSKQRSLKPLVLAAKFTLPFLVPLALVHGMLNPAFHATVRVYDLVPLRPDGFWFATAITFRILILSLIVVVWRDVNPDRLMHDAIRVRLPLFVVVIVAVATAQLQLLAYRIQVVYLAQQARGVPAGPSFLARVRALPRMVIPVIVASITEGSARGLIMMNRGLGTTSFAVKPTNKPGVTVGDVGWAFAGCLALTITWLWR